MGWNNLCVDCGLGGDETVSFGPRQETGSSLYQIDTLATVTSADEGRGCPKNIVLSNTAGLVLAVESNVVIFDKSCSRHAMTLEFGSPISSLAWTEDSRFLAVAERGSTVLHLLHLQTETKLTMPLDDIISPGVTVKSMLFTTGRSPDELVLDLVYDNGYHLRISGIMLDQVHLAATERNGDLIQQIQKQAQKYVFDVSSKHDGQCECVLQTDSYLMLENDNLLISGIGKNALCLSSITNGNAASLLSSVPFFLEPESGITKCRISRNKDYLVTLNTEGHLAVWDLITLEIVSCWFDMEVQDFVLFSTNLVEQDKTSGSVSEDMKVVLLTKGQDKKSLLQVYTFPYWEHVYTLQVSMCSKLADLEENQDSIFFIEGVESNLDDSYDEDEFMKKTDMNVETIRIRCLTEAFPENRFSRLLYKKHFDKAEAFAKEHNLAVELVYKVKATFLLDALSPLGSVQSVDVSNYVTVAEQLKDCLGQIKKWSVCTSNSNTMLKRFCIQVFKSTLRCLNHCQDTQDLEYVINCCLKAQLPTFEATYDMLMYGKEYFESLESKQTTSSPAVQSLLEGLNRLVTFEVAFGLKRFSGTTWNSFLNASIFDEVCKCFSANQLGPGILLWRRHQKEFEDDFSTAKLTEILRSISANVPSKKIIPWLREDFVPFVLTVLPAGQGILADWLCERARAMEIDESRNWPQNALEMAEVMFKGFQEVAKTKHGRGFATPDQFATQICKVSMAFGSHDGNSMTQEGAKQFSAMSQLSDLAKGLREVYLLHLKYACKLSFDEYYKENTRTIAFKLLDRVPAAELIPKTIELYVRPYAKNHNFRLDNLLSDYIESLLIHHKKDNRFREAKIVAIITSIGSPELRCSAVLHFMLKASIPWSEEVRELVDKTVKENPTSSSLTERTSRTVAQLNELTHVMKTPSKRIVFPQSRQINASLQQQLKLAEVKKILLGYGVSVVSFNISDTAKIEGFVKSIIKTDTEKSLEDAMKIGEMYFDSPKKKVYFFQLHNWLLNKKAEDCCRLLRSIPISNAIDSGSQIVNYVLVCLEDPPIDKEDKESLQVITEGGIDILRTLSMIDQDFKVKNDRLLTNLKSILALQREYDIYLSCQQCEDEFERETVFNSYVAKLKDMKNSKQTKQDIFAEELKIRRIAEILRCKPLYKRYAVEKALISRNLEAELDNLFLNLCRDVPSEETSRLLKRVILSFLLENVSNLGSHGITMWAKYVEKFYDVACYCVSFCKADDIIDFFQMARNLSMSLAVSSQFESSDYEEDLHDNKDQFAHQGLDKIFTDDGLILNAPDVIPLLTNLSLATFNSHLSETGPFKTQHISGWIASERYKGESEKYPLNDIIKCSQRICQILCENNLFTRAFQCLSQCLETFTRHYLLIHGKFELPSQLVSKELKVAMEESRKLASDVFPVVSKYIDNLKTELFWKVLQHRHVDHDFAVAVLCSLPQGFNVLTLAKMKENFGPRFSRCQTAAKIGRDYAILCCNQKMHDEYKSIEDSSLWGKRLHAMKIPCKDTFNPDADSRSFLAKKLVSHKDANVELIQEFCEAFSMAETDVLHLYLKTLLLPPSNVKHFPLPDVLNKLYLLMEELIKKETIGLFPLLNDCYPRISAYDYERLEFVLKTIKRMLNQTKPMVDKGILLLEVLAHYNRKVPPTHSETSAFDDMEKDEFIRGDQAEANLAAKRLPFHFLMENQPWKLITPELICPEAVSQMEPIVRALGLSVDQLYSVAIYEIGTKAMEKAVSSSEKSGRKEMNLKYEIMENLLKKIQDPEMVLAAAKWVAKMLPIGEGKVNALKFCVETSRKWAASCGPKLISKAKDTYYRFSEFLKRIHTESVLIDHHVTDESFLSICNQPATLICRLYEEYGPVDAISGKVSDVLNINQIVAKIAEINDCDLQKLENHLLEKWLFSNTSDTQSGDITIHNDVSVLIADEDLTSTEGDNLKRVIYMLKDRDPESVVSSLTAVKFTEASHAARYSHRIRAMQALFTLVPAAVIERVMKKGLDHIRLSSVSSIHDLTRYTCVACGDITAREEFICSVYLRELESLHMSQSVVAFYKCNKEGLVKGLWRNHKHEHIAVRLITDLCIDYKIYDPQLWNVLLPQLLSFGMVQYLTHVVVSVSGVPELRELPCLPKMWKSVINGPLQMLMSPLSDDDEKQCLATAQLLQRCPVILSLDILEIFEHFKRLELYVQAMMCLYLIPDVNVRDKSVKSLLKADGMKLTLGDIKRQREKYGANWQIDEMEEEIFKFVHDHSLFGELHGTEHFDKMIMYLVKADLAGKLILMTVQLQRLKNAFQLVRLYVHEHPQSQTAINAVEHNLDDLQTLMVFLDQEGLLVEATQYLPLDDED